MGIDYNLIMSQVQRIYMAKPLHEITVGGSGASIFEVEAELRQYILRVSAFSEKKQAHTEFETDWTEYLAAQMEGIVKPKRSVNDKLYEVI